MTTLDEQVADYASKMDAAISRYELGAHGGMVTAGDYQHNRAEALMYAAAVTAKLALRQAAADDADRDFKYESVSPEALERAEGWSVSGRTAPPQNGAPADPPAPH